ncbi:src kinase-associated phosphoprotein hypothetical protein [Limosa lapponica baueri]|uniref:Uncharacterized protein n=1 Tax=Limosa lapponica baueri TaxID=1758121 RepID=A0A2I0T358_LIMLA|nr:src kinase-associated phosphoprotein hypothetical protein [Limosa lapponica baueri]
MMAGDEQERKGRPSQQQAMACGRHGTADFGDEMWPSPGAVCARSPWWPQGPATSPGLEEIIPRPVQDTGNILKQGYLEKRSRGKQPKGNFSIENYSARLAFHLRKDSRRKCCFELICPGKRTYET